LFGRYIERDGARNAERSPAIAPTCIPNARERCGRGADYITRSAAKGWGGGEKKERGRKKKADSRQRIGLLVSVSSGISICFRFIEFSFIRGLLGSTDFLSLSLSCLREAGLEPASSPGVNLRARSPFRIRFTAAARRSHSPRLLVAYEGAMGGGGESEDCVTHREQVSESFRCIVPTGTKFAK